MEEEVRPSAAIMSFVLDGRTGSLREQWAGRLWVRQGWERRLPLAAESLEAGFRAHPQAGSYRGRGAVWSVPAGEGERAVLRHYRHGGVLAPLTGDLFLGRT